ncbi:Spo11/DNA topoisomerase VI subunit A [Dipodascopsis tothii]|uniref:Spo11/DNA topoisomerase VI subunit A n=1 Tax=Dipodascopsis tothii TaxID=44089 RepID=UPI0034CD6A1C
MHNLRSTRSQPSDTLATTASTDCSTCKTETAACSAIDTPKKPFQRPAGSKRDRPVGSRPAAGVSTVTAAHTAVPFTGRPEHALSKLPESTRQAVLASIEQIAAELSQAICRGERPVMQIGQRHSADAFTYDVLSRTICANVLSRRSSVGFPGTTFAESRRFAMVLKILHVLHTTLSEGASMTKRDVFYRDVGLFKNQAIVDKCIDDIAKSLLLSRNDLGVVAAQKGLLHVLGDGDGEPEVQLIPPAGELPPVPYVLVIEKEAVFRSVCRHGLGAAACGGLVLTGRGYPDMATRAFLHRFAADRPHVPVLCVVDADPYGIEILCTYRYGSRSLAHERDLTCRTLTWLGASVTDFAAGQAPLTARDRAKACRLLQRPWLQAADAASLRQELQRMLVLNVKAEMNVVGHGTTEIVDYIGRRVAMAV